MAKMSHRHLADAVPAADQNTSPVCCKKQPSTELPAVVAPDESAHAAVSSGTVDAIAPAPIREGVLSPVSSARAAPLSRAILCVFRI